MTARERIDYLLDAKSKSIEIGAFAGEDMYAEHGRCPSGGVVVKIGYIKGKQCIVVANDATVKAGAWFPITGKKNLRAQEIAIENKLPITLCPISLPAPKDIPFNNVDIKEGGA